MANSVCKLVGVAETSSTTLLRPSSISTFAEAVYMGGVVCR